MSLTIKACIWSAILHSGNINLFLFFLMYFGYIEIYADNYLNYGYNSMLNCWFDVKSIVEYSLLDFGVSELKCLFVGCVHLCFLPIILLDVLLVLILNLQFNFDNVLNFKKLLLESIF